MLPLLILAHSKEGQEQLQILGAVQFWSIIQICSPLSAFVWPQVKTQRHFYFPFLGYSWQFPCHQLIPELSRCCCSTAAPRFSLFPWQTLGQSWSSRCPPRSTPTTLGVAKGEGTDPGTPRSCTDKGRRASWTPCHLKWHPSWALLSPACALYILSGAKSPSLRSDYTFTLFHICSNQEQKVFSQYSLKLPSHSCLRITLRSGNEDSSF